MNLKTVRIYENGKEIKKFQCARCDMSRNVLHFFGIVAKNGYCGNDLTMSYCGETYIEIDHAKHECIVIPEPDNIQMLITW
jgi:hypothetical protein